MKKLTIFQLLTLGVFFSMIFSVNYNVEATGWSIETVDEAGIFGWDTSLALDTKGYPHIAFFDKGNYTVKYAKWTGQSWNIETVDSVSDHNLGLNLQITLKLDSNYQPHIVYSYSSIINLTTPIYDVPSYNNSCALKYAKLSGDSWNIETVDSVVGGGYPNIVLSSHPSLALASHNYPHISYSFDGEFLKYAKWTGNSWAIETVDGSGETDGDTSLALDNNDYPHISYSTDGNLQYVRWTGSSWTTEIVDNLRSPLPTQTLSGNPSLALDGNGYAHIIFSTGALKNLTYARWTGSSWDIENFNTRSFSYSLALDNSWHPHICYVGVDGLEYMRWTGSSWENETTSGITGGAYPSLVLDDNGYSHIAYFDESQHLRYAKENTLGSDYSSIFLYWALIILIIVVVPVLVVLVVYRKRHLSTRQQEQKSKHSGGEKGD